MTLSTSILFWIMIIIQTGLLIFLVRIVVTLFLMTVLQRQQLPYVPTSRATMRLVFSNKVLDGKKTIIDLGCGTGTMLAAIGKQYPDAQLIGVEKNPMLVLLARLRFMWSKNKPTIVYGDMFDYSVRSADAIIGFWITDVMPRLLDKFSAECAPGTLVISNIFSFPENNIFTEQSINKGRGKKKLRIYERKVVP